MRAEFDGEEAVTMVVAVAGGELGLARPHGATGAVDFTAASGGIAVDVPTGAGARAGGGAVPVHMVRWRGE